MLVTKETAAKAKVLLHSMIGDEDSKTFIENFLDSCIEELPDESLFTETVAEIEKEEKKEKETYEPFPVVDPITGWFP